jgi:hypothetical protein
MLALIMFFWSDRRPEMFDRRVLDLVVTCLAIPVMKDEEEVCWVS